MLSASVGPGHGVPEKGRPIVYPFDHGHIMELWNFVNMYVSEIRSGWSLVCGGVYGGSVRGAFGTEKIPMREEFEADINSDWIPWSKQAILMNWAFGFAVCRTIYTSRGRRVHLSVPTLSSVRFYYVVSYDEPPRVIARYVGDSFVVKDTCSEGLFVITEAPPIVQGVRASPNSCVIPAYEAFIRWKITHMLNTETIKAGADPIIALEPNFAREMGGKGVDHQEMTNSAALLSGIAMRMFQIERAERIQGRIPETTDTDRKFISRTTQLPLGHKPHFIPHAKETKYLQTFREEVTVECYRTIGIPAAFIVGSFKTGGMAGRTATEASGQMESFVMTLRSIRSMVCRWLEAIYYTIYSADDVKYIMDDGNSDAEEEEGNTTLRWRCPKKHKVKGDLFKRGEKNMLLHIEANTRVEFTVEPYPLIGTESIVGLEERGFIPWETATEVLSEKYGMSITRFSKRRPPRDMSPASGEPLDVETIHQEKGGLMMQAVENLVDSSARDADAKGPLSVSRVEGPPWSDRAGGRRHKKRRREAPPASPADGYSSQSDHEPTRRKRSRSDRASSPYE